MAVTIIGKDPQLTKRCSCRNCSAMLEYTKADTTVDYSTDYLGDKDYYRYLTCPSCSVKVFVPMY